MKCVFWVKDMLMRTRSAGSFPVKRENRSSGFVNVHTKSAPSRDFYTSLQTLPGLRSILLVLLVVSGGDYSSVLEDRLELCFIGS